MRPKVQQNFIVGKPEDFMWSYLDTTIYEKLPFKVSRALLQNESLAVLSSIYIFSVMHIFGNFTQCITNLKQDWKPFQSPRRRVKDLIIGTLRDPKNLKVNLIYPNGP